MLSGAGGVGRGVRWGCADLGVLLLPCRLSPSPTTRPRSLLPLCPQPCSDHVPICVDSEPPAPRKLMTTQAPTSRGPYSTSNPRPPRPLSHSKKPTQVASACRMKQLEVARGGAQGFWISPRPSRGLLPPPQCLDRKGAVATPWGRLPAPGIGGGGPKGVLTTAGGHSWREAGVVALLDAAQSRGVCAGWWVGPPRPVALPLKRAWRLGCRSLSTLHSQQLLPWGLTPLEAQVCDISPFSLFLL